MTRSRLLLAITLAALPGCLFCPDLESAGYVPCAADGDCVVGRFCEANLCVPPPWHDETFGVRRHLIVENTGDTTIAKGAAVPITVGPGGLLTLDEVGVDGRFADYDRKGDAWRVLTIFRDIRADRYTAWLPLSRALPPGQQDSLAWLEALSEKGDPAPPDDPAAVFLAYASFNANDLDGWFESSPGGDPPTVTAGVANVADNQALVLQQPLTPPVQVTFLVRINGNTCGEVFIGLVGTAESIFNDAPSAGLFVVDNLDATFDVAPTAASFPEPVGDTLRGPNVFARVSVAVHGGHAALNIDHDDDADDVTTGGDDLRPPFADDAMYAAIQVGGACSVDVDAVWATPLPAPPPSVAAEAPVRFKLLF